MNFTNLLKVLDEISIDIFNEYKKELGDSNIAKSLMIETNLNGTRYEITLNLEYYWIYIENGRKPGKQPPINKLVDWVKRHNFKTGSKPKTTEQIAYAIARHIAANGLKAKNTLEKSTANVNAKSNIEDKIAEAFALDIEEELNKQINK